MSEYIRNIIFFLVFVSFTGIILPEGKYKSYINLVLGFVLMALVLRPVANLDGVLGGISAELSNAAVMSVDAHEANYRTMIADAVRSQMREQMSHTMDALGYDLTAFDADIDPGSGEIKSITMTLSDSPGGINEIRIAPITLNQENNPAADIKKIVSDFYQLPEQHIYITIQRR
ncbi:MAG: stage III sporulation protein AF [Defluviitaleaceae bacterium]|nr:stage III sporulation protein AF [Defluviitaleaceae bacterium]